MVTVDCDPAVMGPPGDQLHEAIPGVGVGTLAARQYVQIPVPAAHV